MTVNHITDSIAQGGIVTIRDALIEQQERGKEIFRLESGDPSFDTPEHVRFAIVKALADGKTHYCAGAGIMPLRVAAAKKLMAENDVFISPTQVFITNGAMHGLYVAFRSLCSQGDEVIVPDPTWTETVDNIKLAGAVPVPVPIDGFVENVAEKSSDRTRAVVINSPHNPTGAVMSKDELERLIEVARTNDIWIISDEAYEHIVYPGSKHISPASLGHERVISIFSFSKSYAMPGLRLGYIVVPDETIANRASKLLRCTINGVNVATQWGGVAALTGPQDAIDTMVKVYEARREMLYDALCASRLFTPSKPEGAFYVWARINDGWNGFENEHNSWAMTRFLMSLGIGSAPGSVFGASGEGYVRFAFSCATEQVMGASRILRRL